MSDISRKTYTVKALAELSNVTVRTLRFYDEIGLLKPAYYGDNRYRYYEMQQLLELQQILFYRELGFELTQIKTIVGDPKFDKVAALQSHREHLESEARRTHMLISTIDKTLAHIKKEDPMKDSEIYMGFDPEKQAEFERHLIDNHGDYAREKIRESKHRTRDWRKEDFDGVKRDYDEIHRGLADVIQRGHDPCDEEAQKLVRRHYEVTVHFWTPDRQAYIGLGEMYCSHSEFRKLYDSYNLKLAKFLSEAMRIYANQEL